jgi:decaprenyl-phosphate phosphoribosyltransferase
VNAHLQTARPLQWTKNLLVFVAPATAGVLDDPGELGRVALAFVAFTLAASGMYHVNDLLDREGDRRHPRKRDRPIASGRIPPARAWAVAAVLLAAGVGVAVAVRPLLGLLVAGYVAVGLSYTTWLRAVAVVDLAAVAAGFLLRATAGAVAVSVPLSDWFLVVATFGSLYLVTAKRHAEHVGLGEARGDHRATLARYTTGYLTQVRTLSAAVAILAYCLWALERGDAGDAPWFGLSIGPFVLALLRYELLVEEGHGGAPEEVLARDHGILALGAVWAVLVALGVYGG